MPPTGEQNPTLGPVPHLLQQRAHPASAGDVDVAGGGQGKGRAPGKGAALSPAASLPVTVEWPMLMNAPIAEQDTPSGVGSR